MARNQTISQVTYVVCNDKAKFRVSDTPMQNGPCKFNTCTNLKSMSEQMENLEDNVRKKYNHEKDWVSEFKIMTGHRKSTNTMDQDTYKYFQRPIVPFLVPMVQNIEIPSRFQHDVLNDVMKKAQKQCYVLPQKEEPFKSVETQTDYRDSESQTVPWEPSYEVKFGHSPEVLTIAHLTWKHGLPAGVYEIEIINRMRMRRAWEEILPPMDTPANIKARTAIISALEIDEWAFRESEIQAIMDYRMELMEQISQVQEDKKEKNIQDRFKRLKNSLAKRKEKEVNVIRHNLRRELRKLHKKRLKKQLHPKRDIIREHADPTSELYAPQMRFGEHPQRRHAVIRKDLLEESYTDSKFAENIDTLPSYLPTYEELKMIKPKPKPADLCIRETRWTEQKLKQLHDDLKAIRLNTKFIDSSTLMKRKYVPPPIPPVPYRSITEYSEDAKMDRLSTFIQKIVRGRAVQCMMFEGRDRCRELIEELQSTHALEERTKKKRYEEKMQMINLQRLQNDTSMQEDRICEILNYLEGTTVSGLMDFLSKELIRLEDERRAHAFALLAERERCKREALEAGRRQLERHRRREFDEMFRQIMKINQDSVDTYLEDIIREGIEWVSDETAKEYILELSDKVDIISKDAAENATDLAQEEMIANMIYNFVLPEVEKHSVRKNIRENQQNYLRNAHATIYEQIMDLPFAEIEESCDCESREHLEGIEEIHSEIHTTETESDIASLRDIQSILEIIISNVVPIDT